MKPKAKTVMKVKLQDLNDSWRLEGPCTVSPSLSHILDCQPLPSLFYLSLPLVSNDVCWFMLVPIPLLSLNLTLSFFLYLSLSI